MTKHDALLPEYRVGDRVRRGSLDATVIHHPYVTLRVRDGNDETHDWPVEAVQRISSGDRTSEATEVGTLDAIIAAFDEYEEALYRAQRCQHNCEFWTDEQSQPIYNAGGKLRGIVAAAKSRGTNSAQDGSHADVPGRGAAPRGDAPAVADVGGAAGPGEGPHQAGRDDAGGDAGGARVGGGYRVDGSVDSPNFVPKSAAELAARGFERVNDPRSTSATAWEVHDLARFGGDRVEVIRLSASGQYAEVYRCDAADKTVFEVNVRELRRPSDAQVMPLGVATENIPTGARCQMTPHNGRVSIYRTDDELRRLAQRAAEKRAEGAPVNVDAWAKNLAADACHPDALGNERAVEQEAFNVFDHVLRWLDERMHKSVAAELYEARNTFLLRTDYAPARYAALERVYRACLNDAIVTDCECEQPACAELRAAVREVWEADLYANLETTQKRSDPTETKR